MTSPWSSATQTAPSLEYWYRSFILFSHNAVRVSIDKALQKWTPHAVVSFPTTTHQNIFTEARATCLNVNLIQKIYATVLYKVFREPGGGF